MPDGLEIPFQRVEELLLCPAAQDLGQERASGGENLLGEGVGRFGERHDAQMVGLRMAGRGRGHVAHHQIGGTPERGADAPRGFGSEKVQLEDFGPGDRLNRRQVDGEDKAPPFARAAPLRRLQLVVDGSRPAETLKRQLQKVYDCESVEITPFDAAAREGAVREGTSQVAA